MADSRTRKIEEITAHFYEAPLTRRERLPAAGAPGRLQRRAGGLRRARGPAGPGHPAVAEVAGYGRATRRGSAAPVVRKARAEGGEPDLWRAARDEGPGLLVPAPAPW